jgi:hypothetical protein
MTLFTDPVAQVIITDVERGVEWKWDAPNNPFLTGVTLNYNRKHISAFTCSFDIPYEKAMDMLKVPGPFKVRNKVVARIGWASGLWTPWAGGALDTGGDGLSVDSNGLSGQITVRGVAESYGYTVSKDTLTDVGWDAVKILENCADGMGLKPVISPGAGRELNNYKLIGGTRGKAIRKEMYTFTSSLLNLSYWEVVKKICSEHNLMFWIAPEVGATDLSRNLFISTRSEASKGTDQDVNWRTYMIRGTIDEANSIYPCFAWSPEGSGSVAWMAHGPDPAAHGAKAVGISSDTGEDEEVEVLPAQQPMAIFGQVADKEPVDEEVDGLKVDEKKKDDEPGLYTSVAVDEGSKDRMKKQIENRQAQGNAAQKGNITTIGMPDERAGNLCELRGAGAIYDGTYEIDLLSHVYAPGSWETTLTVHRHGRLDVSGDQQETADGQMPSK